MNAHFAFFAVGQPLKSSVPGGNSCLRSAVSFAFPRWLAESLSFLSSVTLHLLVLVVLACVFFPNEGGPPQIIQLSATTDWGDVVEPDFELAAIAELPAEAASPEQPEWNTTQLEALAIESTADELAQSLEIDFAEASETERLDAESTDLATPVNDSKSSLAGFVSTLRGGSALVSAYEGAQADVAQSMGQDLRKLQKFKPEYVVVLRGAYDQIEHVLRLYKIPHMVVPNVTKADLTAARVLCINCGAAPVPPKVLLEFVDQGGMVVSTDWGIMNVQQAFPEQIGRARGQSEEDATFVVNLQNAEHRLMKGVAGADGRGSWWLERGSFFVEIRSGSAIPLVTSRDMSRRYHTTDIVACLLNSGKGELLQLVSHVYLQDGDQPGLVAMHRLLFNFLLGAVDQN